MRDYHQESYDILMKWFEAGKPETGEIIGNAVLKKWQEQGKPVHGGSYARVQVLLMDEIKAQPTAA